MWAANAVNQFILMNYITCFWIYVLRFFFFFFFFFFFLFCLFFVFLFINFSVCFVPAVICFDICCMSLHIGVYYLFVSTEW